MVVGAGVTVWAVNGDGTTEPAAGPTVQPSTTTSTQPSTTPLAVEDVLVDPVVPGWQGVRSPKDGVVYDVPKDWKVLTPGTLIGYERDGKVTIVKHGVSRYLEGACGEPPPGEVPAYRGSVGFVTADSDDPDQVAPAIARKWAEAAATDEAGEAPIAQLSPPEEITVANGTIPAVTVSATVVPEVRVTTVAFTLGDGSTRLFLMALDQQVPDALDEATAAQMIQSIRPAS